MFSLSNEKQTHTHIYIYIYIGRQLRQQSLACFFSSSACQLTPSPSTLLTCLEFISSYHSILLHAIGKWSKYERTIFEHVSGKCQRCDSSAIICRHNSNCAFSVCSCFSISRASAAAAAPAAASSAAPWQHAIILSNSP